MEEGSDPSWIGRREQRPETQAHGWCDYRQINAKTFQGRRDARSLIPRLAQPAIITIQDNYLKLA
jgi:hypothetical protein